MTKIASWLTATTAALVMLFSYHTSTEGALASAPTPGGPTGTVPAPGQEPNSPQEQVEEPLGGDQSSDQSRSGDTGETSDDGFDPFEGFGGRNHRDGDSGGRGQSGSEQSDSGQSGSGQATPTQPDAAGTKYSGTVVNTRWGDVQVQITVENGKITAAQALLYPWSNPRDQQINAYAVPILNAAVVDVQGADIDMVSGATVTSQGYIESLQAALDEANL